MNLNAIAGTTIAAISPPVTLKIQVSTGPAATAYDGNRTPTYAPAIFVPGNLCPMSFQVCTTVVTR